MICDKCNGQGHLTNEGKAYDSWISPHYKAEIVGCVKDIEKGTIMYNFWIKEINVSMHITVPIEYYYMTTGAREWNLELDETGNKRKKTK